MGDNNSLKYLSQIATALKVPAGQLAINSDSLPTRIHNNSTVTGFLNIVFTLLKQSNLQISGRTKEDKAEIYQWLEYALAYAANIVSSNSNSQLLNELNSILATRTFLVSNSLTVADIVLYYFLQSVMVNLSYLEKEKFINVSRWFDNLQNVDNIRQKNSVVDFKTIFLVSVAPARH